VSTNIYYNYIIYYNYMTSDKYRQTNLDVLNYFFLLERFSHT